MNGLCDRDTPERVDHLFEVQLEAADAVTEGHGLSLGSTGMLVLTERKISETTLRLVLLVEPALEVELIGYPVWQQRLTRGGRYAVGISFVPGQCEQRERISAWMVRHRAA